MLRDDKVKKEFEEMVVKNWEGVCEEDDVRQQYKSCVLKAADEVCGWTKGKCRHGETWWWNEKVRAAVEKKTRFKEWLSDKSDVNRSKYNLAKKCAKRSNG